MKRKSCKKCGIEKPFSAFYRAGNVDGRLNECKECVKARVRQYRLENLEYIQEYDRKRGYLKHRKEAVKAQYRIRISTKAGKKREHEQKRKWIEKNRHKRNVHIVVGNAIKRGLIIPERCYDCGAEKTDAHHEDYSKPFEITWLCKECHGAKHRELNEKRCRCSHLYGYSEKLGRWACKHCNAAPPEEWYRQD